MILTNTRLIMNEINTLYFIILSDFVKKKKIGNYNNSPKKHFNRTKRKRGAKNSPDKYFTRESFNPFNSSRLS